MKLTRILVLLFSLSLPAIGIAYPTYSHRPTATHVTYCNAKHCPYCHPTHYGYYCDYCHDYYEGCPECNKDAGKLFLIGVIIVAAAYLIDQVWHS